MNKIVAAADSERFRSGAEKYAAYLETPEGRLRFELTFANLQEFLPLQQQQTSVRALDLGGGTGVAAIALARLGIHVTLLDSSLEMLDFAKNAALQAGVTENIALKYGDVAQLANMFPAGSFDLILCHNLLEYVDDPAGVLLAAAGGLRDSSGILSVLIRNRAGEVLKAAIKDGDLAAAEHNLCAEHAHESLYGGIVRLFATDSLHASLRAAALAVIAERGVRVMSDYLPPEVSRTAKYQQILALERKLGRRPEFAAVARYTHLLARRAGPASQVQS